MYIASLFIIAKKVKTNQMSIKNKIDKLWYILRMEYYLEMKINKLQIHGKPQMNLINIILSKRNKVQKWILYHFLYINVKRGKTNLHCKKSKWQLPLERRKEGMTKRGYEEKF